MFEEQREPLFRFLFRLTRNASDAEDLLQETFLAVWRKRGDFDGRGSAGGYLRRTGYRLFLNARERRLRRADLAPTTTSTEVCEVAQERSAPHEETDRREVIGFLASRVREALDGLPDVVREAFVMFRYEGLTCAQIADITGAPVKTVETRVGRATQLLAQKLRPLEHHMTSL